MCESQTVRLQNLEEFLQQLLACLFGTLRMLPLEHRARLWAFCLQVQQALAQCSLALSNSAHAAAGKEAVIESDGGRLLAACFRHQSV